MRTELSYDDIRDKEEKSTKNQLSCHDCNGIKVFFTVVFAGIF
ncbi:MAG TPA: hypothetical protein VN704_11935 [Verrucomicrobiae bacterium]|nr:hypothetical protein [Verrucomicrobiae bacterium]